MFRLGLLKRRSFACLTIKDRLPVILVKVVDTLCQDISKVGSEHGEVGKEEVKRIIGRLTALQNEMFTKELIKPLISDGPDVSLWNSYLVGENENSGFPAAWYESSWLYVECYFYRRIKEAFELSSGLKDYDPFHTLKLESLLNSMDNLEKLGNALHETIHDLQNSTDLYSIFASYLEVSLWGNKCDLALSAGTDTAPRSVEIEELRNKILVNNTEQVWNFLKDTMKKSGEVHIHLILDNAGYELFCDFCFLHFLLKAKLATKVSLYVKRIPWFVSDTLEKDILCMLEILIKSKRNILVDLGKQWLDNLTSGMWVIENELFWTLPHDYSEMLAVDPKLYAKLSQSDLVIFKGDLNYRKLTGGRQWNESTAFTVALNKFLPTSLLTLRTIKADVVVGLEPGATERLNNVSQNWRCSGEYALMQFSQKE